jgi:hypothetical protein
MLAASAGWSRQSWTAVPLRDFCLSTGGWRGRGVDTGGATLGSVALIFLLLRETALGSSSPVSGMFASEERGKSGKERWYLAYLSNIA